MINIDDLLDLDIDEISRLLDGDIDSITEIFLEGNDLASNLQTNRENDKMLLKETAILSESLAGKSVSMDSTIAVDSEFIVNVNRQIKGLDKSLSSNIRKPESIRKKVLEYRDLFESDLVKITSMLEDWSNRIRVYDQIELDDDEIDLLEKHYAAILDSTRMDKDIATIEADIAILEGELS